MAVQAMIANADGFFTLGYNYALFLDPKTNRFVFIPGDQELSFANFAMMGSADQLMDMSVARPYGGENRLADRLLDIKEVREAHQKILKELATTVFRKERLLADAAAIEGVTEAIVEREEAARADRAEPPVGFGPPGAPTAPDLRTFAEKTDRLDRRSDRGQEGRLSPPVQLRAAGRERPPPRPIDDKTIGEVVKAPPGFKVSLFAAPPRVGYPVTLSVAPDGAVYVAVDEQGSLGRTPGGGRVVRCIDDDGDGKADRVNVFAKMEHPRGVIAQDGKVWVLHPPFLSVFLDEDGDGISDRQDVLVSGLTTSQIDERGGDHTTNGIRMGLDGWIYIAVGDYGFHGAKGKDGTTLSQRGGGILRVRPDGTELEVFAIGLRNPFAIAIDPYLNLFTRDNTNDGAGWDVRVSHLIQTADYGYSQRFANFPDEIMPPLGAYGQGGGTGALSLQDERWPRGLSRRAPDRRLGPERGLPARPEARRGHVPGRSGRVPVDPEADGYGHRRRRPALRGELARWRGRRLRRAAGRFPRVRRPAGLDGDRASRPEGGQPAPPHRRTVRTQCGLSVRCAARDPPSRAIPGDDPRPHGTGVRSLQALARSSRGHLRTQATRWHRVSWRLAEAPRRGCRPRVRTPGAGRPQDGAGWRRHRPVPRGPGRPLAPGPAQAVIGLGRLGDAPAAPSLVPLTSRPDGSPMPTKRPVDAQPDPGRVVPHLAMRALVALRAVDACLDAIDGPHREGALRALRSMHEPKAVEGLVKKLATTRSPEARRDLLATLVRLYHREADYRGSWWGIRPDTNGPYFEPPEWEGSGRIASVLKAAVLDGDPETVTFLRRELARRRVRLEGLPADSRADSPKAEEEVRVLIVKADPKNPDQIGNMAYEAVTRRALQAKGDAGRGQGLFAAQSCRACHTDADGQTPKGPHLVDIGKRYSPPELVESILKPSAKIAQGYESYGFAMADGRVVTGFIVGEGASAVQVRESSGTLRELKRSDIAERRRHDSSAMPEGVAGNLTPEQLADLVAYLQSLSPNR